MKQTIIKLILITASAFIFTSCSDSKDKVINDSIELMEDMASAMEAKDQEKIKELEKAGKAIEERAKKLDLNIQDESSLSESQKKRLQEAMEKTMKAAFSQ